MATEDALLAELKKLGYNPDQAMPYYAGLGDQQQTEGGDGMTYWPNSGQLSVVQDIYGALKAGGVNSLSDLQAVTSNTGAYGAPVTTYINRITGQPVDLPGGGLISISGDGTAKKGNVGTYLSLQPNKDGTVGTSTFQSVFDGGGFQSFLSPVLQIASIIPSPIQPFAQAANAALAASQGNYVQAALSAAGAANSSGLLGGPTTGTLPTDLGLQPLSPITPVDISVQPLPMPVPGYNFSSPNFDMAAPGLVMNPITNTAVPGFTSPPGFSADLSSPGLLSGPVSPPASIAAPPAQSPPVSYPSAPSGSPFSDITGFNNDAFGGTPKPTNIGGDLPTNPDAFGPGFGNLTPGMGVTTPGGPAAPASPSLQGMIDQAKAAGKSVVDWMKDPANSLYARAAMMAGGALLNTVGGSSSSGGSSYKDDGYRPTISRGGWQASIPAPGAPSGAPGRPSGGFSSGISLPSTGQANDGLWRFAGQRASGLLPSLASAMPFMPASMPPTGLIGNYDPKPTGPLPTNVPPMMWGYDDPVVNSGPQLPPGLTAPLMGLLNTNPAPRGWM